METNMYSYEDACDRGYDGPSPAQERAAARAHRDDDCDGCWYCDPEGLNREHDSNVIVRVVKARKARYTQVWDAETRVHKRVLYILPGDTVRVQSWFTYTNHGPRTGYHHNYFLVTKGAGWATPKPSPTDAAASGATVVYA